MAYKEPRGCWRLQRTRCGVWDNTYYTYIEVYVYIYIYIYIYI